MVDAWRLLECRINGSSLSGEVHHVVYGISHKPCVHMYGKGVGIRTVSLVGSSNPNTE